MNKKKLLFLPFLAVLAIAGCSKEEGPDGNSGDGSNEVGYVAVNIVQPRSVSARAGEGTENTGFQNGTEAENTVTKGIFFIFNDDGTQQTCEPQVCELWSGKGTSTAPDPEVERIYSAVLVVNNSKTDPSNTAKQIVCVLNPPAKFVADKSLTLQNLRDSIGKYDACTPGAFIMTNSVYRSSGAEICGAPVTSANIKGTNAEAVNNPVDIYVERVVAKVRAHADNFDNNAGATVTINQSATEAAAEGTEVEKKLTIKVTGIEIANIAQTSYLFKCIDGFGINVYWMWDTQNRRSYWETMPAGDKIAFDNQSYDQIVESSKNEDGSDFDISKASLEKYIQPNTPNIDDKSLPRTSILVTAQLLDGDKPADLVYFGGKYYDTEGAKKIIANFLKAKDYYKKTADNRYESFVPADFVWENKAANERLSWLRSYEVVAKLDPAKTYEIYQKIGEDDFEAVTDGTEVINGLLAGDETSGAPYKARVFTEGKCYYFVNIDHTSVANSRVTEAIEEHTYDGVVRNHIYDLTLSSIKGVGVPVFNPEDVIIPEVPSDEDTFFLAARVNVLDWRLVSQKVDFEIK